LIITTKNRAVTVKAVIAVLERRIQVLYENIRINEVIRFIRKKDFSWLDVGCGEGLLVKIALNRNIKIAGIDVIESTDQQIIQADITSFPFKKQYDCISFYHVLEHLKTPQKVLADMKQYLHQNGLVVIEVPTIGNLTHYFLKHTYFIYYDPTHINFLTKSDWEKLITSAGYTIIGQGKTWHQFPFTLVTTSFKLNIFKGLISLLLFVPFKVLSILHVNDEIIRFYCQEVPNEN
jgi:SAM-dependent methyltransferase